MKENLLFSRSERLSLPLVVGALSIVGFFLAAVRFFLDGHFSLMFGIQFAIATVFGISVLLFRTGHNESAVHIVLSAGVLANFAAMVVDGSASPGAWLPFVPLLAAFLANKTSAIVYTIGILVGLAFTLSSTSIVFDHFSLALAIIFSCSLGIFLEHVRTKYERKIEQMATTHPLTGLPSRILFDVLLERSTGHFDREGIPFTLVFIDVDGLKTVNDTFGHPAGDALLKEVSARLRGQVRENETLFHISGDEFVIIAAGRSDLEPLKTRIREICGEFSYMDFLVPLFVSVGAAVGTEDSEASLLAADSDMYVDKRSRSKSRRASLA